MNKIEIITVPILPLGVVNAFVIKQGKKAILVDAGLPDSEQKFASVLKKNGLTFKDVSLIVITHAHIDHAGGAAGLRRKTNAKIVGHEGDLEYYERRERMTFCPSGNFGSMFLKTGFIKRPYEAFTPDILLKKDEEFDLAPYGIPGKIRPTPGHTCGSLSVILDDGAAVVGDMISSGILIGGVLWTSRPKSPPFEDDPARVSVELVKMVESGSKKFYMGHGGPLGFESVLEHAKVLSRLPADKR